MRPAQRYTMDSPVMGQGIVIADDRIGGLPVGGVYTTDDIDQFLDLLEHGPHVRVIRLADDTILLAGGP